MNHLTLRPLAIEDLDFLVTLEQAVNPGPWSRAQFRESLDNHKGVLVLEGEKPLGYAMYWVVEDQAELLNIAVVPEKQGQGIGGFLLTHCLKACQGVARQCYLEVRASNFTAIRFYLAKGFRQIGERRDYYSRQNGRENALVMAYTFPGDG